MKTWLMNRLKEKKTWEWIKTVPVKTLVVVAVTLVILVSMSGCATSGVTGTGERQTQAGPGGAVYSMKHVKNQETGEEVCEVEVTSGRELAMGNLKVTEDCSLEAEAEALGGQPTIDELLKVAPYLLP